MAELKKFPVACHTANIAPGGVFVAIKGQKDDGVAYIKEAVSKGASKIVVSCDAVIDDSVQKILEEARVALLRVDNTRKALAEMSAEALGHPARKLKIIGITGTKGKTTTSFLIEHILKTAGYKTALLTSVRNRILANEYEASLTTPQPDYLQVFFDTCVKAGVETVVMEVAAQAKTLHRIDGIFFDALVFTNFSQEHAEFYASQNEYFAAKKGIIDHLKSGAPLIANADDERVAALGDGNSVFFSIRSARTQYVKKIDLQGNLISSGLNGISFELIAHEQTSFGKAPALIGIHNLANAAAAFLAARVVGVALDTFIQALDNFAGVPGRLNQFNLPNGAIAFIDHAHNPSSFDAVLSTLRTLTTQLIVVSGAGGDRDATKRPIMGALAARFADIVILTTDNPRSEDPAVIVDQIKKGISHDLQHKVMVDLDRERAIHKAYQLSRDQSIIALLGKGPDEYQLIKGSKIPFSEKAILKSIYKNIAF